MLRHLPNMLTGLRLAAAPATAGLVTTGHFDVALGLFAFAGVSDAADGFLAKRMGVTSRLGRFLDPAADKALMFAAFLTLTIIGDVPLWLTLSVFLREVLLMSGIVVAVMARANIVLRPSLSGKAATTTQVLYIVMHLAALAFGFGIESVEPTAAYLVAALTLISGLSYCGVWLRAMRARPRESQRGS
jgi:cardiolipin synthase